MRPDIGYKIFQTLKRLFGEAFAKNLVGKRSNIIKPKKLDTNAPTANLYSKSALKNPKALDLAEKKIEEYAPYILSNRNIKEQMNFLENAENVIAAKNAQTGVTESMVKSVAESMFGTLGKSEKTGPNVNVFDLKTQQKVDDTGIMKLQKELGLPEGVEPGSMADKAIKESAQYKMDKQGVKSILDENYQVPKTTALEDEDIAADIGAKAYSVIDEARRRPVVRQILLKDTNLNLPEEVRTSLKNLDDLQRGADQSMDPLELLNKYYDVTDDDLFRLEGLIDEFSDPAEAIDNFLKDGGFKLKATKPAKEVVDDVPEDLAMGGRPGGKGLDYLMGI
jgi:hypothetical protein|tara:strand:- start:77 stop:1084 length:1008 start_codon:yes stop_codon:yes gene_type:complete